MNSISKPSIRSRGGHVTVNGIRLHYLALDTAGAANGSQPLILIPGITSPAITWSFVGHRLAEFTRVFIVDNRGRGLSSGGEKIGYLLEDYALDTAGLIEALGLEKPVVLGHSMGGRIAIKLASERPDLVGCMIAADPPVTGPGRRPYPIPLQWYIDGIEAASRGEKEDTSSPILKHWSAEQLELRAEWLPTCDKAAIAASHASFHEEEIHSLLPAIQCRSLLIYAENGNTVDEDDASEFVEAMEDCQSQRIDGVGHMIPWDDLDGFVGVVRNFVQN
ncbi:MAG: alpha/beta hydrolase [Pseudomonadota bacterium]|nr:alpha/beta hydrolase [Pseudomonadota bacterium]